MQLSLLGIDTQFALHRTLGVFSTTALLIAAILCNIGQAVAGETSSRAGALGKMGIFLARGDGEPAPLDELAPEGPVILHFWATWCAPCRTELPALDRFVGELARRDAEAKLLAISVDTAPFARVEAFLVEDLGLERLGTWLVAKGNPGSAFGLFGYPATLLVDGDGTIRKRIAGPVDWDAPALRAELFRHLGIAGDMP